MKRKYINDVWQRALKTFIQAFLGILIPEVVAILQSGLPESGQLWYIFVPILCSAFASAISACWNLLNNALLKEDEEDERDNTK